jgi:hypothetical protein
MEDRTVHRSSFVQKIVLIVALAATLGLTASTTLGALVSGALPAAAFTYTSVTDNSVSIASSGITLAHISRLQKLIASLSAVSKPTAAQRTALADDQALLANYQARYAAAIDLRANKPSTSRRPTVASHRARTSTRAGTITTVPSSSL